MANDSSSNTYEPGKYVIDKIELRNILTDEYIDLNGFIRDLTVSESIYSYYTYGHVTINDSQDIISKFNTARFCMLTIEIHSKMFNTVNIDKKISGDFYVYSMNCVEETNKKQLTYTLFFRSYQSFVNENIRLSKRIRGTLSGIVSEMLTHILSKETDNDDKTLEIFDENDESKDEISFIANWWSPHECIDYALKRAANIYGNPDYLVWQSLSGNIYNLASLTDIISEKDKESSVPYLFIKYDKSYDKDIDPLGICKILKFEDKTNVNYFKNASDGMYGTHTINYDTTFQLYHTWVNNVTGEYLNDYTTATEKQNEKTPIRPTASVIFEYRTFNLLSNFTFDMFYIYNSLRKMRFAKMNTTVVDITVLGFTNYRAGHVARVFYPKMKQFRNDSNNNQTEKTLYNTYYSGNYIVQSIDHMFSGDGNHTCRMRLMKDSYIRDAGDPTAISSLYTITTT